MMVCEKWRLCMEMVKFTMEFLMICMEAVCNSDGAGLFGLFFLTSTIHVFTQLMYWYSAADCLCNYKQCALTE